MKIKKRETFCLQFRACSCIVLEQTQNNAVRAKKRNQKYPGLAKFGIAPGLGAGAPNRFDCLRCCTLPCFYANSPNHRSRKFPENVVEFL